MSDSAWLAAYEAQKAAVMMKMQQKSESVSGTSKFSGLVDTDQVRHAVKSNQVTKLMNNLKKHSGGHEASKKPAAKVAASDVSPTIVKSLTSSTNVESHSLPTHKTPTNHLRVQPPDVGMVSASVSEWPLDPPKFSTPAPARPEASNLKRKNRSNEAAGIGIKDLIKKVKSDAARKQSDWAEVTIVLLQCLFSYSFIIQRWQLDKFYW